MRAACVLAAATCLLAASNAFVVSPPAAARCRSARRQQFSQGVAANPKVDEGTTAEATTKEDEEALAASLKIWDRKKMPAKNDAYLAIPPEARHWEVQDERVEVWEDLPNPIADLNWHLKFAPSEEELEAAKVVGFDWTDEWFEESGEESESAS